MRKLNYYVTSLIHLSLEDYHNAGLTPEQTKEAIESIRQPGRDINLWCVASGINRNWDVHVITRHDMIIWDIVSEIEDRLEELLSY